MALVNTIIEINGRKYDARTGKLISRSPNQSSFEPPQRKLHTSPSHAQALDIIDSDKTSQTTRVSSNQPNNPTKKHSQVANGQTQISASNNIPTSGTRAIDIKPNRHKAQRAKTLLRTVVKKPTKTSPKIHSTSTIAQSTVERSATGRGVLLKRVPDTRLARAKQVIKSTNVHKYVVPNSSKKPVLSSDLSVIPAPSKPTTPVSHPAAPAIIKKPALAGSQQTHESFNHPLANATNHKAPKLKKPALHRRIAAKININPKLIGATAAVCAVIVTVAFLAYQNVPAVAMRVAANRAGFSGSLPGNPPAGFAVKGPIEANKGTITVKFKSNSDERSFAITQKPSDWTPESLLANNVLGSKARYQTYRDKGLTVFIYNNGDATWVNKGIWYSITGKGSLSSDQVLAIAGSM